MNTQHNINQNFNATEFCSSKLWEIVSNGPQRTSVDELKAAVAELAERRHYLRELESLGVLSGRRS